MRRSLFALCVAALLSGTGGAAENGAKKPASKKSMEGKSMTLTWCGQACYLLTSPGGTRVLMDPIPDSIGYPLPAPMKVEAVTFSHEHFDHTNVSLASGPFTALHGLTEDKKGWMPIDKKVGDVRIRNVGTYHDAQGGKLRGLNAVFVFETGGLKFVHLGDLGHVLSEEQVKEIGPVDVLMIPVGGYYTIGAKEAHQVIAQLKPKRAVLPMHYKTDVLKISELAKIDAFLNEKDPVAKEVERVKGNTYGFDSSKAQKEPKIILLDYK